MSYTYRLNGAWVNPEGDWEISYQRNEGQIFFRRIFAGELTFLGDDYTTLMGFSDCDVLDFQVYCKSQLWWEGQFKFPYNFEIDEDSCAAKGEPEVVDEYTCIMDKRNTVYKTRIYLPVAGAITPTYIPCGGGGVIATLPFGNSIYHHLAGAGGGVDGMINDSEFFNCGGIDVKSSFLWRDNFPNGINYAGAYGGNNYITGAANRLEYIYLFPSFNIRASLSWGGTVCDEGLWSWSFKDWEDFLRNAFNAYWFIDENGAFRVEHIHYFDPDFAESDYEVGIDLNTVMSSNGKMFAYRKNKYTYETGELYDQEKWTWLHWEGTEGGVAHADYFEGVPVFYGDLVNHKSDCVPGEFKEKELASQKFWSDIPWAVGLIGGSVDTISCDGYCFIDINDPSGANDVNCETELLHGVTNIQNGHCCTANLLEHYHTYDRIFIDGDMNSGNVVLFDTAIRTKLQEEIEFTWCCDVDFDPLNLIRTGLGNGTVKAATHKKRSIIVELLY